jgi:hypothetical protein
MIRTAIASLVAGAALAAGAGLLPTGPAAATDGSTACERVWEALPAQLQDDIRAALGLSPRAQHRALLRIRYGALHGRYGDQVKAWAERLRDRRIEVYRSFPAELKADIRSARALPFRAQREAMDEIRAAALNGEYGDDVQRLAEKRKAFLEGCPDDLGLYVAGESDPLAG